MMWNVSRCDLHCYAEFCITTSARQKPLRAHPWVRAQILRDQCNRNQPWSWSPLRTRSWAWRASLLLFSTTTALLDSWHQVLPNMTSGRSITGEAWNLIKALRPIDHWALRQCWHSLSFSRVSAQGLLSPHQQCDWWEILTNPSQRRAEQDARESSYRDRHTFSRKIVSRDESGDSVLFLNFESTSCVWTSASAYSFAWSSFWQMWSNPGVCMPLPTFATSTIFEFN